MSSSCRSDVFLVVNMVFSKACPRDALVLPIDLDVYKLNLKSSEFMTLPGSTASGAACRR
ncbi:hypothetical protein V7S43_013682 [Phytophthora oleae]|uniref:Uncharacterized protein n=1 Tax=Phytophthora oleae TaxID=2107226 RepID=A0ABD3F5C9_9STRA